MKTSSVRTLFKKALLTSSYLIIQWRMTTKLWIILTVQDFTIGLEVSKKLVPWVWWNLFGSRCALYLDILSLVLESVYSTYSRFTDIVNTLEALGKTFSNSKKIKKIIRSLPKEWRPKRTVMRKPKI